MNTGQLPLHILDSDAFYDSRFGHSHKQSFIIETMKFVSFGILSSAASDTHGSSSLDYGHSVCLSLARFLTFQTQCLTM